jgi:L-threonylcarbamoyladenylate synthase
MLVLKIDPGQPDEKAVAEAGEILRGGGVVAFPTETFYALGADARREAAVERVFRIKGRDFRSPIALTVAHERDLPPLVEAIPRAGRILMDAFWPGPLTLVLHASPQVVPKLTAGTGKIGVRVSSHAVARLLAGSLAGPLTATSANRSGSPECTSAEAVIDALGENLDAVVDGGPTPGGLGSTLIDVTSWPPTILRRGAVPVDQIHDILGLGLGGK